MQLISGKIEFNACQVSLLWHNSFLVSLWTFQATLIDKIFWPCESAERQLIAEYEKYYAGMITRGNTILVIPWNYGKREGFMLKGGLTAIKPWIHPRLGEMSGKGKLITYVGVL